MLQAAAGIQSDLVSCQICAPSYGAIFLLFAINSLCNGCEDGHEGVCGCCQ